MKSAHIKVREQGAAEFLCKGAWPDGWILPVELIDRKIEHFKQQGCTLFI